MSFLMQNNFVEKNVRKRRTGLFSINKYKPNLKKIFSVRKRVSFCRPAGLDASMTVEAAFVLPFFLFAFLNLISILEIYRLQSSMSAAMHMTAKEMAVYAYEYKQISGSETGKAESFGLTYIYVANKVRSILGADYLNNLPIKGGQYAISWIMSSVLQDNECIDLIAAYRVRAPVEAVGFGEFNMYNRICTRAWTGYDNAAMAASGEADEEIVYITPEGKAFHKSRSCTYLKLSIVPIDIEVLNDARNENGEKYYPCGECGKNSRDTVYITNYGNRYHSSLQCGKLKRTIFAVPISKTGGRTPCRKCS